jgi:hypothetical protein
MTGVWQHAVYELAVWESVPWLSPRLQRSIDDPRCRVRAVSRIDDVFPKPAEIEERLVLLVPGAELSRLISWCGRHGAELREERIWVFLDDPASPLAWTLLELGIRMIHQRFGEPYAIEDSCREWLHRALLRSQSSA